jgi:hypothetical protein
MNIGSKGAIYEMKAGLKKLFDCIEERKMHKYVSFKLDVSKDKRSMKII